MPRVYDVCVMLVKQSIGVVTADQFVWQSSDALHPIYLPLQLLFSFLSTTSTTLNDAAKETKWQIKKISSRASLIDDVCLYILD